MSAATLPPEIRTAVPGPRSRALAAPARVVTLVISDVAGDDPALVASGPTIPIGPARAEVRHLIALYGLALPAAASALLASHENEPPRVDDPIFARNTHRIIASAAHSLDAAARAAEARGIPAHILSDAESLCSRVGILAQGRLVASGRLSEILAFELRGWELVVANLSDELRERLRADARSLTALAHGRYTIELAPDAPPERFLEQLAAGGARVISLNPVRETLEDYFVQTIGAAPARETGL